MRNFKKTCKISNTSDAITSGKQTWIKETCRTAVQLCSAMLKSMTRAIVKTCERKEIVQASAMSDTSEVMPSGKRTYLETCKMRI